MATVWGMSVFGKKEMTKPQCDKVGAGVVADLDSAGRRANVKIMKSKCGSTVLVPREPKKWQEESEIKGLGTNSSYKRWKI